MSPVARTTMLAITVFSLLLDELQGSLCGPTADCTGTAQRDFIERLYQSLKKCHGTIFIEVVTHGKSPTHPIQV